MRFTTVMIYQQESIVAGRSLETGPGGCGRVNATVDGKGRENEFGSSETRLNADMNLPKERYTA